MKIKVTFPKSIRPETFKKIIEGNIKANSVYTCEVTYVGSALDENNYEIESDNAYAFYLIGMTASALISKYL